MIFSGFPADPGITTSRRSKSFSAMGLHLVRLPLQASRTVDQRDGSQKVLHPRKFLLVGRIPTATTPASANPFLMDFFF